MKKNALKALMLSTLVAGILAGCNDTPASDNSTIESPSNDQEPSVSDSVSVTESESLSSESDSTSQEESSTPTPTEEKINARVTLPKRIYLRSELNARLAENKPAIELESFEIWANALKNFRPIAITTYSVEVPEGTGNLQCKAIVSAATKYVASFGIEVYDTIEQAVEAHKDVEEAEFKESLYFKNGKMVADAFHLENEVDGKKEYSYYYNAVKQPITYVDNADALRTYTNYSWASKVAYIFSSTDKNTTTSVLDPTKKSAPHHPLNEASTSIEKVGTNLVENVTAVDYSKTYNLMNRKIAASDYGVKEIGYSNNASELIIDAEGNICYLGIIAKNEKYYNTPLVANELGTKDWYCSPLYQGNDYSTIEGAKANTNPALLFADDYDPNDPEKMYHFEKVIPEGGYHIIDVNNYATWGGETSFNSIDNIWRIATGLDKNIYSSLGELDQAVSFENESLNASKVFYRNGKFNGITFQKQIALYVPSDTYHTYAYLKYKSGTDNTKLEYADVVQEALKAQKSKIRVYGNFKPLEEEKKGPLHVSYYEEHGTLALVSLSSEPLLAEYYSMQSSSKINEWEKIVLQ